MAQYDKGRLRLFETLSGLLLGKVSFFLAEDELQSESTDVGFGNEEARSRLGTRSVFAWPFPEAATVPRELGIVGDSHASMGTAPDAGMSC